MWMDQMIVSKYYEFTDFEGTDQFNLGKTFMKGAIGTHGFFNYIITNDYIKMADDAEFTENVLTIRRSSLKDDTFENGVYIEARMAIVLAVKAYDRIELKIAQSHQAKLYYGEPDFTDACKTIYKARNPEYGNTDLTLKLIELFYNYILPKYGDTYVWLIEDNDNYDKEFKSLLNSITAFVNSTSIKYSKLIDVYNSNKDKLMDKLQSVTSQSSSSSSSNTNINLQNDVPGTENLNEYSFDESHTSMAYKDTNSGSSSGSSSINYSTDTLYIMDKLQNVKDKLVDIYNVWSDEFHKILMGYKPY